MTMTQKVINVSRKALWTLLSCYIGLLAVTIAAGVTYSNYAAHKAARAADQRWCTLLTLYHNTYHGKPPNVATPQGAAIVKELERQYQIRDCAHAK